MARKNTPKVYKRNKNEEPRIHRMAKELLENAGLHNILDHGWDIFVTRTRNGYCKYSKQFITIPEWAIGHAKNSKPGYDWYYVAHELAHVFTSILAKPHGDEFMQNFIKICPPEFQHYELNYKPTAAKRNGIRK